MNSLEFKTVAPGSGGSSGNSKVPTTSNTGSAGTHAELMSTVSKNPGAPISTRSNIPTAGGFRMMPRYPGEDAFNNGILTGGAKSPWAHNTTVTSFRPSNGSGSVGLAHGSSSGRGNSVNVGGINNNHNNNNNNGGGSGNANGGNGNGNAMSSASILALDAIAEEALVSFSINLRSSNKPVDTGDKKRKRFK
jgi:hypothetical protein